MQTLRSAWRRPPASLVTRIERPAASQRNQRPSSERRVWWSSAITDRRKIRSRSAANTWGSENNAGSGTISRSPRSCSASSATLTGRSIDGSVVRSRGRPQTAGGRIRLNRGHQLRQTFLFSGGPKPASKLARDCFERRADEVPDRSNEGNKGHHDQHRNQGIFDRGSPVLIRNQPEHGSGLTADPVLRAS